MEGQRIRLAIYARCSTADQSAANGGYSIAAQLEKCRQYADLMGAEIVAEWIDEGVSGSKPLSERPGGQHVAELLKARKPNIDSVLISRLDRIGRDAAETLQALKSFRTGSVGLISIADRLDLGTPQGRAMAAMSLVFADLERGLAQARTVEHMARLRRAGKVFGHAPFGWVRVGDKLAKDATEQAALVRIRSMRDEGSSYRAIASALAADGVPTKRGGEWAPMTVRMILESSAKMTAMQAA